MRKIEKEKIKAIKKEQRTLERAELLLRRTEGDVLFLYRDTLSRIYTEWASRLRDSGITPTFMDFYNQLSAEDREHILVSTIN